MKKSICCFIGHQNLQDYDIEKLETALEEQINQLQEKGVKYFFQVVDWALKH